MVHENQTKGKHKIEWKAERLETGPYYFEMRAGKKIGTGKLIKIN